MAERIDTSAQLRRIEHRANVFQVALTTLMLTLLGLLVFAWWAQRQTPGIRSVAIEDMRATNGIVLCPGETFALQYRMVVEGAGVFDRDITITSLQPQFIVVGTTNQRIVTAESIDQVVHELWPVTTTFWNPSTGSRELLPAGEYTMNIALTSRGRILSSSVGWASFEVRADCEVD